MLAVAVEIASQVLRQSLRVKPELLLPVVREAVAALPMHHGHPALFMTPADAALVHTHLGEQLAHNGWRILEDSTIEPGRLPRRTPAPARSTPPWRHAGVACSKPSASASDWLEQKSVSDRSCPSILHTWRGFLEQLPRCRQPGRTDSVQRPPDTHQRPGHGSQPASNCRWAVPAASFPLGGSPIEAEVVGFNGEKLFLMPSEDVYGLSPGARVVAFETAAPPPKIGKPRLQRRRTIDRAKLMPVGEALLGRVVDGAGRPLDSHGPLHTDTTCAPCRAARSTRCRAPRSTKALDVGIRAINSLLTVGRGQRMGLFAGSGVGKSVLLGMMARYTEAEVIVVGLIGERGREVKEFIEQILGEEGLRRSVVVAAPADVSPLMRLQGAAYATAIAEYFRDQGKQVLLIMDSLTRYAMAQREIALAIGEPPVTRGYPPSVFARLPQLVERAGNGRAGGGSITAFYTVLAEGDDQQDPIADAARAILDGHIVLSRTLADSGHYPAIDIEQSISRAMVNLIPA